MPKLSIIVPVYNISPYLRKCIESIIEQSFTDFECILVDDGAKDGSGEICDEYALADNRITVIHRENGGVSTARNSGLDYATGEYITFCDGDDYYSQGWLSDLVDEMDKTDADMVTSGYLYITEEGEILRAYDRTPGRWTIGTDEEFEQYAFSNILYGGNGWEIWSSIFKRSILEKNRIRFCENCGNYAEDLGFVLEYVLYAKTVVAISGNGYNYVKHDNSMIGRSQKSIKLDCLNEVSLYFAERYFSLPGNSQKKENMKVFHFLLMHTECAKLLSGGKGKDLKRLREEYKNIKRQEWDNANRESLSAESTEFRRIIGFDHPELDMDAAYLTDWNLLKYKTRLAGLKLKRLKKRVNVLFFAVLETRGRYIRNFIYRSRLKNRDFSIISSNCNGGVMVHDLGLRFDSPFVNLFLPPEDFLRLLRAPKEYIENYELEFIHPDTNDRFYLPGDNYPVAKLKDITLYFYHYTQEQEAKENWDRRKKRIHWDNLFFLFSDRDGCTYEMLKQFDVLPYSNKVVFTHKQYPELRSAVYIHGFEREACVGICSAYKNKFGKRYFDDFDYVGWLNQGK